MDQSRLSATREVLHSLAKSTEEAMTPKERAKVLRTMKEVGSFRLIILVLLLLQAFGILLPAFAISTSSGGDNVPAGFRVLFLMMAFVFNITSAMKIGDKIKLMEGLQTGLILKYFGFLFETSMFSLQPEFMTLIIMGGVSFVITAAICALILVALRRIEFADPYKTEEYYTVFATKEYDQMRQDIAEYERRMLAADVVDAQAGLDVIRSIYSDDVQPDDSMADSGPCNQDHGSGPSEGLNGSKAWHKAYMVRRKLFELDSKGFRLTAIMFLFVSLCLTLSVIYEFGKLFTSQHSVFTNEQLSMYQNPIHYRWYMPSRTHSTWKVHLVVMDGLRYDMTEPGASALGDYIHSPVINNNKLRFKARAQLPSFSVPNWVSMLTGANPENHGVTGNLLNTETPFDHVYRQVKDYGLHGGMTGTPWWRDLVFTYLPRLDGDGTVDASFTTPATPAYPWSTADPADWERLSVSVTATRRAATNLGVYDFFLTHFSDIDKQGHELGVDTKWNPDDTYMKAIENKTIALQQIIGSTDSQTVVIITSDHGHVMRGGHGGISDVLRDVPVIFYVKGRFMGTPPARQYFSREYENVDLPGTISALLGIPVPRQSQGAAYEEIISMFVPPAAQWAHYYDIVQCKAQLLRLYHEATYPDWGNTTYGALNDPDVQFVLNFPQLATIPQMAVATEKLRADFDKLREDRLAFDITRNVLLSLVTLAASVAFYAKAFDRYTVVDLNALKNPSVAQQVNRAAAAKALITVALYLLLCLAQFTIGYFAVTGYDVWDSTLVHTTSTAPNYFARTVIAPAILYIILTKVFIGPYIKFHSAGIAEDRRLGLPVGVGRITRWIGLILKDTFALLAAPTQYKPFHYLYAYLYLHFLCFFGVIAMVLLMLLSSPYTFMVPFVLSTTHVTSFNLEWRFRIITTQIFMFVFCCGTFFFMWFRLPLNEQTMQQWDDVFQRGTMEVDSERLEEKVRICEQEGKTDQQEYTDLLNRRSTLEKVRGLIGVPDYQLEPRSVDVMLGN